MLSERHRDAAIPPRRRQPGAPPLIQPRPARDTDAAESAFRHKRLAWSLPAGLMGAMLGWRLGGIPLVLPVAIATIALVFLLSGRLAQWGADGARAVLMPSGRSTPSRHGFSQADAYILQRRYAEAAELIEHAAMDEPGDPEAYLRLARLHRDHLNDPRRAVEWFRHACATQRLSPGERRRVDDELAALRLRLDAVPPNPG